MAVFERSCRLALALEKVTRDGKFDAMASFDQVWLTDPRVGIIPSYGTGRLCEIGLPCSTEADVTTVTAMLMLQELTGQATFLENYVIDFKRDADDPLPRRPRQSCHGRPADVTIKHSIYYQGVKGFGASYEYAYAPGPVTNLALVTMGEGAGGSSSPRASPCRSHRARSRHPRRCSTPRAADRGVV